MHASFQVVQNGYYTSPYLQMRTVEPVVHCDWPALRRQLLDQWRRLTPREIDEAGPDRYRIAQLIQRKYGIASELVENYLNNFVRTMPLMTAA